MLNLEGISNSIVKWDENLYLFLVLKISKFETCQSINISKLKDVTLGSYILSNDFLCEIATAASTYLAFPFNLASTWLDENI